MNSKLERVLADVKKAADGEALALRLLNAAHGMVEAFPEAINLLVALLAERETDDTPLRIRARAFLRIQKEAANARVPVFEAIVRELPDPG